MNDLNKDYKTRNLIIFGEVELSAALKTFHRDPLNWMGGIARFENLSLSQLKELIDNNFIDLEDCQNSSPSVGEFYEFMKSNPKFTAHGYAVSHERSDYRVSIEGVSCNKPYTKKELADFVHLCRRVDDLVIEDKKLYSWWD